MDDYDYWALSFSSCRINLHELELVFQPLSATDEDSAEKFSEEKSSVRELGMTLSEKLLRHELGLEWEQSYYTETELWLLGTQSIKDAGQIMFVDGIRIDMNTVDSREDLIKFLTEYGPTHSVLMDFCEDYRDRYRNDLCWVYPISDGKHLGTYLVLVKEGILSLPYDNAREEDYEMFCLDHARILQVEDINYFIEGWHEFSSNLNEVMHSMSTIWMQ